MTTPPRGPLLYVTSFIGGKVFTRRRGEPPSFACVEAVGETVPPEWFQTYEALRERRREIEQGCGDLATWWREWEDFQAILHALGCSKEFAVQLLPDGRLSDLEPQ